MRIFFTWAALLFMMKNTSSSPCSVSEKLPQRLKAHSRSWAKARTEMSFSDLWICILATSLGNFYSVVNPQSLLCALYYNLGSHKQGPVTYCSGTLKTQSKNLVGLGKNGRWKGSAQYCIFFRRHFSLFSTYPVNTTALRWIWWLSSLLSILCTADDDIWFLK